MSFWKKVKSGVSNAISQTKGNLADFEDTGILSSAASYFANPLIAQDIAGSAFSGALSRGADPRTALAQAGTANQSLANGGTTDQWTDLAAFNAALAAGAATGGAAGGFGLSGAGAGLMVPGTAAAVGAGVGAGALAYGGAQLLKGATGAGGGDAETPPDLADMYANDPNTSAQFSRLRKSARMLGRAGTFKNKGSASALGLGEQILGDQMSLIGA